MGVIAFKKTRNYYSLPASNPHPNRNNLRINEIFKTEIPEGDDYATLSGLLHEKLQDIPQAGDKIEVEDLRIVVEKVFKNVPQKIRIEKIRT